MTGLGLAVFCLGGMSMGADSTPDRERENVRLVNVCSLSVSVFGGGVTAVVHLSVSPGSLFDSILLRLYQK
jgi:hypothetical protein